MSRGRYTMGFTLLELVVAASMIAMLLVVAYGSYLAAAESVSRCTCRMTLQQRARALLLRMSREVRCCYVPVSEGEHPNDSRWPYGLLGGRDRLRLATAAGTGMPDELSAGVCVVSYQLDESRGALLRKRSLLVDQDDGAGEGNWPAIARDVRAMTCHYFDGDRWLDTWDAGRGAELPRAVRITITFEAQACGPMTFSTTARIARRAQRTERSDGIAASQD